MKMVLADLAAECFDESIALGEYDEMTARIQKRVLSQVKDDPRRRRFALRQALSIALIAAALVSAPDGERICAGAVRLTKTTFRKKASSTGKDERDKEMATSLYSEYGLHRYESDFQL